MMLSETTITYTSVPQDEGEIVSEPIIRTLPSGRADYQHTESPRDCYIAALSITFIVIIAASAAVTLTATLGSSLLDNDKNDNFQSNMLVNNYDYDDDDTTSPSGNSTEDNMSHVINDEINGDVNDTATQTNLTAAAESASDTDPSTYNASNSNAGIVVLFPDSPILQTTYADYFGIPSFGFGSSLSTGKTSLTTKRMTTPYEPAQSSTVNATTEKNLNQLNDTTVESLINNDIKDIDDVDIDSVLNDIYGFKPNTQSEENLTSGISIQKAILAGIGIFIAISIISFGAIYCIKRRLSKRRRLNLQTVITDLQSRDKIALMNSDDSDA